MDEMIDIQDLSVSELMKSKTYIRYSDECGVCSRCKEMTSLLEPCCSDLVYFEGSPTSFDSIWEEIEDELRERAKEEYENQERDKP